MIRGHVDGFEARYICGWAVNSGNDKNCLVRVVTDDGIEIAKGRAFYQRADLIHVGGGRANIAFRIPIEQLPDVALLHIIADGQALGGSPILLGPEHFDGRFSISSGFVQATVTQRVAADHPPHISLIDQYGRVIAEGAASFVGETQAGQPQAARIEIPLLSACFGFEELLVRGYANGHEFALNSCSVKLAGYLEELSAVRCSGWLLSPDAPQHKFEIEVFQGDTCIGFGPCQILREDVQNVYSGQGRVGFDFGLKLNERLGAGSSQISVRLVGSLSELFNGPFLITDLADSVSAIRRAAYMCRTESRLSSSDRQVVQLALSEYIGKLRDGPANRRLLTQKPQMLQPPSRRLNILIPIYKGVEITKTCIESVLTTYDPYRDTIILVNDHSPEPMMESMLNEFRYRQNVHILYNSVNLGFVGSINRGLAFCRTGHVVLLNSDTVVYPGAWNEMEQLLAKWPGVGTITAMSNNATIFSYPSPRLKQQLPLDDISWKQLASDMLEVNAGRIIDVPTGHGFCMVVRREVLDSIGHLDSRFGRGYGEENDLCMRAADHGWRNVAACGVLVEHRESVSFGADIKPLLQVNLRQLDKLYPEYTMAVMEFERTDPLRKARWPLDQWRLKFAAQTDTRFVLLVQNWLDGGTHTAITDIESAYGYDGRERLMLTVRQDGMRELAGKSPLLLSLFAEEEDDALFEMLDEAGIDLILVHQLLGFSAAFVTHLTLWGAKREMRCYIHDFYTICPRVTMLDPLLRFCEAAETSTCGRCVAMGGSHDASRLKHIAPAAHRTMFHDFLKACDEVIAPSNDTVSWMRRVFDDVEMVARPHPQFGLVFPKPSRDRRPNQILLLGSIGPHKGSRLLLRLAQEAYLAHPELIFHVIGHTDIDRELLRLGNVRIYGRYNQNDLPSLVERTGACVALFLHQWPETFSYTLSEAMALGLWPISLDLGAPAERIKAGLGSILARTATLDEIVAECRAVSIRQSQATLAGENK